MANDRSSIKRGSQNVFVDIGVADAHGQLLKAGLVSRIQDAIDEGGLTQAEAAKVMGIGQPDVSRMLNGNFRDVSVERLLRFLRAFGYEIDLVVRKAGKRRSTKITTIHTEVA